MSDKHSNELTTETELFGRVVSILEQSRNNVVRAINANMVTAYWLIGREIVQALQGGEERAEYGKQALQQVSKRLAIRYGKGFSVTTLRYFRAFYLAYSENNPEIQRPLGAELSDASNNEISTSFNPNLSWSHYRVLMRIENPEARRFYEQEAITGGWDKRTLERQTSTQYYERCLHSQQPCELLDQGRQLQKTAEPATDTLKNPYILEFLGYPNFADLHESDIEIAIITHLQRFLLELGNGFAFVARQKHIRIEEDSRFIDLVFYHCHQKFYLLIDLKLGKLTHGDVGQMDGYVRMFDGLIGLILCTEKCDTVARYSVLNDRKQIFASKYMVNLPTEEQLQNEIEKERKLIEAAMAERDGEKNEGI